MPFAAIASFAGPVISGIMGSDAASEGVAAQERGAAQANATQRYMYDTTRADNAPFLATGTAANKRLAYLMGLRPSTQSMTRDQLRAELLPKYQTEASGAVPVYGSSSLFEEGRNIPDSYRPAVPASLDEAGLNAAIEARLAQQAQDAQTGQGDADFGSLSRNFSSADLNADPVYQSGLQFGLNEGTKGINRQAAAGGSLLSGATLKALTRFGNDYGSTKANESSNRFGVNQDRQYNRLAGLAGTGQTASSQVGAAGANMANNISANQIGVGNAQAAGGIAGANAISGGISSGYGNYQGNQLLKILSNRNTYNSANNFGNAPYNADVTIPMQPGGGY